MNPQQFQQGSQKAQPELGSREWLLYIGLFLALALFLALTGRGGPFHLTSAATIPAATSSPAPAMNNHLYVPCSVSTCDPTPAFNNHLYIPCSVSTCDPTPAFNNHLYIPCSVSSCDPTPVINNHLYIPCSVSGCNAAQVPPEQPRVGKTR